MERNALLRLMIELYAVLVYIKACKRQYLIYLGLFGIDLIINRA